MDKNKPIGILDSGIGGLTVAREVVKILPGEDIIYYADNLHLPYGPKPQADVRKYAMTIMDYLIFKCHVKYVVIACNTATVASLEKARETFSIPIIGPIEEGAKKAIMLSKNQKIGVIGTTGTINSGGYQDVIKKLNPDSQVVAIPAPRLPDLVEEGHLNGPEVTRLLKEYLTPIINTGCDSLILGCTHYPFLLDAIREVIQGKAEIIFPGTEIAVEVKKYLEQNNLENPAMKGKEICITSKSSCVSREFLEIIRMTSGMELKFREINLFE